MYPRFLITLDEELEPKPVTVRVGTVRSRDPVSFLHSHPRFLGCRRRRAGGQTAHDLWLPDLSNTRTTGDHRTCGTRNGRVHSLCERVGRVRVTTEKSRLGGEDGTVACLYGHDIQTPMYFFTSNVHPPIDSNRWVVVALDSCLTTPFEWACIWGSMYAHTKTRGPARLLTARHGI